jgi:hypothetical protein
MSAFVVDENVPIVANDSVHVRPKAPQADSRCRLACVQMLNRIVRSGTLVIDSEGQVLENYRAHLQHSGQPGVGDAFYKHIFDHQFDQKRVRRIALEKNAEGEFKDFPIDPALATFDPSDRVYVAPAIAAPHTPIVNAVDSDYSEHKTALEGAGVRVHEICPQSIRRRQVAR